MEELDRQRLPYLLLFGFCVIAAGIFAATLTYNYFVAMPAMLRGTWYRFTTADGLLSDDVSAVAADDKGNVWFATERGVSVLTAVGDWTHYQLEDGLGADSTHDVLIDQRGRVWVATSGGLSRFDGTLWRTFTSSNSNLPDDSAVRLALDVRSNVWVLSREGLSVVHSDDTITHVGIDDGLLLLSPDNQHWWHYYAGSSQSGLGRFDRTTGITRDSHGDYWFCTLLGGVVRLAPDKH